MIVKKIRIVIQKDIRLDKMLDNFNRALRGWITEISRIQTRQGWRTDIYRTLDDIDNSSETTDFHQFNIIDDIDAEECRRRYRFTPDTINRL